MNTSNHLGQTIPNKGMSYVLPEKQDSITLEQRVEAQCFLMHLAEQVNRFVESHPSFDHTSWHIAPDLSWCAQEGTMHTDSDSPLENRAWVRNAPGCAITIVKV